jgi:hypothetical protein
LSRFLRSSAGEVVVESEVAGPLTAMRSTVIISLRMALAEAGLFESYAAHLSPRVASELEHSIAGVWLPVQIAEDHYEACDALQLPMRDEIAIGSAAASRILNALVGTALRLAATAGSTPWGFLQQVGRFWNRAYEGSGLRVTRRGPKEAEVTVIENSVHQRSPFARHSFCGFAAEMMKPFCTRYFMKVAGIHERPQRVVRYLSQWV